MILLMSSFRLAVATGILRLVNFFLYDLALSLAPGSSIDWFYCSFLLIADVTADVIITDSSSSIEGAWGLGGFLWDRLGGGVAQPVGLRPGWPEQGGRRGFVTAGRGCVEVNIAWENDFKISGPMDPDVRSGEVAVAYGSRGFVDFELYRHLMRFQASLTLSSVSIRKIILSSSILTKSCTN
ncbi:hypothetical protein F511_20080 [Dorcoceras hygrometricum]|uniref:Uncharacterized protein n=1 Tax=Dorcoceras hygrometricum TaxID=472368 RepID=A0A2Z7DAV9_9LAMI|nr:hypothetical protein F511_20080 [Dorcoceras hygrometricum]